MSSNYYYYLATTNVRSSFVACTQTNKRFTPTSNTFRYGQLGRKEEALEIWRKLLADVPGLEPKLRGLVSSMEHAR